MENKIDTNAILEIFINNVIFNVIGTNFSGFTQMHTLNN